MHYSKIIFMCVLIAILTSCTILRIVTDNQFFVPREYYGAKLESPSTVLHGGGQDFIGFKSYRSALGPGRQPVLYMTYVSLGGTEEVVSSWEKRTLRELRNIPTKDLMLQIGVDIHAGRNSENSTDDEIAAGSKDAEIEAFCNAIKAIGLPVFVRIGYEFEGRWNNYKTRTYSAAYIRITKALRAHNIKAATVWCSAGPSAWNVSVRELMDYYPGDEWVDWWGIDLFSEQDFSDQKTIEFCKAAAKHRKPVMIGESTPRYVGVLDGKKSWDTWFAPYFQFIKSRPGIKAFCYINWEWRSWSERTGNAWTDWGDCRIEENEYVRNQYRKEMDLPLYEHAQSKGDVMNRVWLFAMGQKMSIKMDCRTRPASSTPRILVSNVVISRTF